MYNTTAQNLEPDKVSFMGVMPTSHCEDCEGMENPIFLTRDEVCALYNTIGHCILSLKSTRYVMQDFVTDILIDEEVEAYTKLQEKLLSHLNKT